MRLGTNDRPLYYLWRSGQIDQMVLQIKVNTLIPSTFYVWTILIPTSLWVFSDKYFDVVQLTVFIN